MVTDIHRQKTKSRYFSYTPYGELVFYGEHDYEITRKEQKELKTWCKTIQTSLIYIWINRKCISYSISKVIMQLLFDLERYNNQSRVIVQWNIDKNDFDMQRNANSFKNLFPHVAFIFKLED